MRLTDFVVPEAILTSLDANTKAEAIRGMIEGLSSAGRIPASDTEAITSGILKREELGSTGIGNGVAVPHTKHPAVDRLTATVALSDRGVDFDSLLPEDSDNTLPKMRPFHPNLSEIRNLRMHRLSRPFRRQVRVRRRLDANIRLANTPQNAEPSLREPYCFHHKSG